MDKLDDVRALVGVDPEDVADLAAEQRRDRQRLKSDLSPNSDAISPGTSLSL